MATKKKAKYKRNTLFWSYCCWFLFSCTIKLCTVLGVCKRLSFRVFQCIKCHNNKNQIVAQSRRHGSNEILLFDTHLCVCVQSVEV